MVFHLFHILINLIYKFTQSSLSVCDTTFCCKSVLPQNLQPLSKNHSRSFPRSNCRRRCCLKFTATAVRSGNLQAPADASVAIVTEACTPLLFLPHQCTVCPCLDPLSASIWHFVWFLCPRYVFLQSNFCKKFGAVYVQLNGCGFRPLLLLCFEKFVTMMITE